MDEQKQHCGESGFGRSPGAGGSGVGQQRAGTDSGLGQSGGAVEAHLVRLGPPGKGDTIHRSTCRYAVAHSNALRWVWADRKGFESIDWDALRRHGIKPCGVCDPEALR